MSTDHELTRLYDALLCAHGHQNWWPTQDEHNPRFEILIAAVLVQHTAWRNAEAAVANLRVAGPLTPRTLIAHVDLSGLIRKAGTHQVKAKRLVSLCRWFLDVGGFESLDGVETSALRRMLRSVHGIGPETADVMALYAFGRPAFVADAYAFRIFERFGLWSGKRNYEQLRRQVENTEIFDVAQYQELHALIVAHAKTYCFKSGPNCSACPLVERCRYGQAAGRLGGRLTS